MVFSPVFSICFQSNSNTCNIKHFAMKALAHISHDIWLFCARPDTFVKAMTHLLLLALIAFLLEGAITQLAESSLEGEL